MLLKAWFVLLTAPLDLATAGDANPALSPEELEVGKSWATLKKAWEAWMKQIDHWDFNGFSMIFESLYKLVLHSSIAKLVYNSFRSCLLQIYLQLGV